MGFLSSHFFKNEPLMSWAFLKSKLVSLVSKTCFERKSFQFVLKFLCCLKKLLQNQLSFLFSHFLHVVMHSFDIHLPSNESEIRDYMMHKNPLTLILAT